MLNSKIFCFSSMLTKGATIPAHLLCCAGIRSVPIQLHIASA